MVHQEPFHDQTTRARQRTLAASRQRPSLTPRLFGLLNGRSANPEFDLSPLSVEGAFATGDLYQNIGARVNYSRVARN